MNDTLSAETVRYAEKCAFKCVEDRFCVGYNYNSKVTDYETVNCLLSDQFLENTVPFKSIGWVFYQFLTTVSTR